MPSIEFVCQYDDINESLHAISDTAEFWAVAKIMKLKW